MQNPEDMMFCENCKMNAYPSRPEFNTKIFWIFVPIVLVILIYLQIMLSSVILLPISVLFWIFYYIWGFMFLNPYVIFYGLQKKRYCPKCKQELEPKNMEYKPFGKKEAGMKQ